MFNNYVLEKKMKKAFDDSTAINLETLYGYKIERLKECINDPDIGEIINGSDSSSFIRTLPNKSFVPLIKILLKTIAKQNNIEINNVKGKKYIGLVRFYENIEYKEDSVTLAKVIVDEDIQNEILKAILNCDLDNAENLRKIDDDINHLYRMLGERCIDAFKKFYKLRLEFFQQTVKAICTLHLVSDSIDFLSFDKLGTEGYKFQISYLSKYNSEKATIGKNKGKTLHDKLDLGDILVFAEESLFGDDSNVKYFYNDACSVIIRIFIEGLESYINENIPKTYKDISIGNADDCDFKVNLIKDVRKLFVTPYAAAQITKKDELDKAKAQLNKDGDIDKYTTAKENIIAKTDEIISRTSNEYRSFVQANKFTNEEAGKLLYYASSLKIVDGSLEAYSGNAGYLNVAQEFFMSYLAKKSGYSEVSEKLYGNTNRVDDYTDENGYLAFKDGYVVGSNSTIFVNCEFNGVGKVVEEWNEDYSKLEKVIYVSVEEIIKNNIKSKRLSKVFMYKVNFIDIDKTLSSNKRVVYKTENEYADLYALSAKGATFKLMPIYRYIKNNTPYFIPSVLVGILNGALYPVAKFNCNSNELQKVYAGLEIPATALTINEVENKGTGNKRNDGIELLFNLDDCKPDYTVEMNDYDRTDNNYKDVDVNIFGEAITDNTEEDPFGLGAMIDDSDFGNDNNKVENTDGFDNFFDDQDVLDINFEADELSDFEF